jgi:hypothetical protein
MEPSDGRVVDHGFDWQPYDTTPHNPMGSARSHGRVSPGLVRGRRDGDHHHVVDDHVDFHDDHHNDDNDDHPPR